VLTWQNRIVRVRESCQDLWGRAGWQWRVIRTSNCYQLRDPQAAISGHPASEFGNRAGTQNQEVSKAVQAPLIDRASPLERALARFGEALATKDGIEQGAGG
jgi:hypothetical protein